MKKILSLILALSCVFSCVFALASCDDENETEENPDKAFFDAVAASKATEIKTLTYYTLEGEEEPFNGSYETSIKANGDFTFAYTFTRMAELDDADDPDVKLEGNRATLSGVIKYENGKYYSADGEELDGVPAVTENQPKLNLDKEKLGEYEMNDAKTKLTATLSAEAASEILGMEISATSDVVIVISTNGTYLTRISVTYDKGEAKVKIDTSYS